MPTYDYIVVGSGIAGLYTAILAHQAGRVLLITKGSLEECNTRWAQGGIAAAIGPGDTTEMHLQDTQNVGAGLNDPETTRILAEDAPDRIADLIGLGVPFDTVDGEIALAREGAHRVPRVLHAGGDATGAHIETTLATRLNDIGIEFREYSLLADIRTASGAVEGVQVFDSTTGIADEIEAAHVVLATGGAGQLFRLTTNSDVVTGDGVAAAFRAGVEVMDMEFFQFHPTALRLAGAPVFLVSEAVRGEGGILRDLNGRAFMADYDPLGDLAARDVVARAIVAEMRRQGNDHVFLDVTRLPAARVTTRFPQIYQFCRQQGLDITKSLIPVAPAAHYMMGGIKVNSWGETNVQNLLATGETSCTGAHGANRLASNSLLETLVFSKRLVDRSRLPIARAAGGSAPRIEEHRRLPSRAVDLRSYSPPTLAELRELMWERVGIERDGHALETAVNTLTAWAHLLPRVVDRASYELRNAVTTGRLMAEAALYRTESRGAHYRADFPSVSSAWAKHVVWRH